MTAAATPPPRARSEHDLWAGGAIAVVVAAVVVLAWTHRAMVDDGFINLRVVQMVRDGYGPVFNQGQRVEAFTSPLWIGFLVVADTLLPARLEWIAALGGVMLTAAGMVCAGLAARKLLPQREDAIPAPIGLLVLLGLPPIWVMSTSGLENGLSFAWLGLCGLILARWSRSDRRVTWWSAAVLGLGPLVRPEFLIYSLCFLVIVLVGSTDVPSRHCVSTMAAWAALPAIYEVFRMAYYGELVASTALAKSATDARWGPGLTYLRTMVSTYWLWVPAVIAIVALGIVVNRQRRTTGLSGLRPIRKQRKALVVEALVGAGLLNAFYIVRVGGDYWGSRLLLPAVFALCVPIAVVPVRRVTVELAGAGALAVWALWSMGTLRSPFDRTIPLLRPAHAVLVTDFPAPPVPRAAGVYYGYDRLPIQPPASQQRPTVAAFGIGALAYRLGPNVDVFDVLGLAEPVAAHLKLRVRGYTGHEKLLPAPWIAALLTAPGSPTPQAAFPVAPPPINFGFRIVTLRDQDDPRGRPFDERVATARRVLTCAPLRDLIASAEAPLSPRRAADNFLGAWHRTFLQVPGEPADAERALCR